MLHGYKLHIMMNNIAQTEQEHLKSMKQNHEEAAYLEAHSTIYVEVHGLRKTLPIRWFATKSCTIT
jgi:hypothetical protein